MDIDKKEIKILIGKKLVDYVVKDNQVHLIFENNEGLFVIIKDYMTYNTLNKEWKKKN